MEQAFTDYTDPLIDNANEFIESDLYIITLLNEYAID